MPMRRLGSTLVLALAVLVLRPTAHEAIAQPSDWYDAQSLLLNLRPEDQREAARYAPQGIDSITLYDMAVRLTPNHRFFYLREDIYYTNTTGQTLSDVVLRVYANAVGEQSRVALLQGRCFGRECTVEEEGRSAIVARLAQPLRPNERVRIRVRLRGALTHIDPQRTGMMAQAMESQRNIQSGNIHGDYGLLAESAGTASLGNFYAMIAARRDNEWVRSNESTMGDLGTGDISHFRAQIHAAPGSRVAVSGHVESEETLLGTNGRPPVHRVKTVSGFSRNFAIIISRDLVHEQRVVNGVTVRSWFLEADRSEGERVMNIAAEALAIYERRFGRYPYRDLDLVEAPLVGGAGGVEFSGLVTVAKMFYPSGGGMGMGILGALMGGQGGGMREAMIEFVTVHEVAHQWWHGLVGSDSRMHPFVDESLAQFSSVQYMRDRYGDDRAELEARRQVASNYHMMRMQGVDDGAVDRPVSDFGHPMAYAGLVYGKGAFAYREVQKAIGDPAFFRAVQRYVRENRFGVAPPRALFDRFASGRNRRAVRRIERRWLDGQHGDEDLGSANTGSLMADWLGGGLGGLGGGGQQGGQGVGGVMDQVFRALGAGGGNGGLNMGGIDLNQLLQGLGQGGNNSGGNNNNNGAPANLEGLLRQLRGTR